MSADPSSLRPILDRLIDAANLLGDVLEREKAALIGNDLQAIASAAAEKDALSQSMANLQRELDHVLGGNSLRDCIAAAPSASRDELEPVHTLLKERLDACRHHNAVNGKVVHRSRQSVAELARILSGTDADPIYTATGKKRSAHDGLPIAHA